MFSTLSKFLKNDFMKSISSLGLLLGVYDGHGGGACAQVIAKRLFHYITACLLPHDHLQKYLSSLNTSNALELIRSYNDKVQFVDDVRELYHNSFIKFVQDLHNVRLIIKFLVKRWCSHQLHKNYLYKFSNLWISLIYSNWLLHLRAKQSTH